MNDFQDIGPILWQLLVLATELFRTVRALSSDPDETEVEPDP